MANNLAPLKIRRWKKHLFRGVKVNKYHFAMLWGFNLYIYLTLNNLKKDCLSLNQYNGKNGHLHHPKWKNSHFWGFLWIFGHIFYIQLFLRFLFMFNNHRKKTWKESHIVCLSFKIFLFSLSSEKERKKPIIV